MKKSSKVILIILIIFAVIIDITVLVWLFGDDSDTGTDDNVAEAISEAAQNMASGTSAASEAENDSPAGSESTESSYSDDADTVIMVYMIGSDLESTDGSATDDLNEMISADLGKHVKIVVETGGCSAWQNDLVSSDCNQVWTIDDDGFNCVVDDAGDGSMTDKDNLTDFISWTAENYPANRYMMIFWDHGGGTAEGYGYDENNDTGSLSILDLNEAMKSSGVKFDIVGFDACLMGTIETAYAI